MDWNRELASSISVRRYHPPVDPPNFPRHDPADAAFWDVRYEARFAPWDAGAVPPEVREFVASRVPPGPVLVPGCGSARDVRFLAASGWDVVGIDFSQRAVEEARQRLGPFTRCVRRADFFAPISEAPFALVYERAFLCALPRRLWRDWARRVAQLVAPGALLAGFFYLGEGDRGPPFPLHGQDELDGLLAAAFERLDDRPARESIAAFAGGRERWQVWRRRSP